MPQGRRKVPFSCKQKKQQLQAKKDRKKDECDRDGARQSKSECRLVSGFSASTSGEELKSRSFTGNFKEDVKQKDVDRYRLQFVKESKGEIENRKQNAYKPLLPVSEEELEVGVDEVFMPGSVLDMPKRPRWNYSLSRDQLEAQENSYFSKYLINIEKTFNLEDLSYFETNLETWRQLWRVLELADVVLIIVDIRFPSLLFSPALFDHAANELKRDIILVLNKIDLAPPSVVAAWRQYFTKKFPNLHVICFTSFPGTDRRNPENETGLQKKRRRRNLRMAAEGAKRLLRVCQDIVKKNVDLSSWEIKIEAEMQDADDDDDVGDGATATSVNVAVAKECDATYERFKDGVLTIGCLGFPNVGKSSLMNAIMGKKVVSVSRTPGHTKHFQTIFLTPTVRLCDCPGLVFPSKVPKALQILNGSYPIAQVREPFSSIRYVAERIPLVRLLRIQHPDGGYNHEWTPYDICDGWAEKRGFYTAKGARRDVSRAGNNLLRMCLEGRVSLCLRPPEYSQQKVFWQTHRDLVEIHQILGMNEESHEDDNSEGEKSDELSPSDDDEKNLDEKSDEEESGPSFPQTTNKFALLGED